MKVIKPGLFTTVQDLGRYKHEKDGFSVAGVMNQYFYKIATSLVDNENSAVLEVTLNGPMLKFIESNIITFVAYDAEIYLDDLAVPVNTAVSVYKGQILHIKQITKGTRGYLAFHKSLEIEPILGSLSTHTRSGIGGYKGRMLKTGDTFRFKDKNLNQDVIGNKFTVEEDEKQHIIPIIKGLQIDQFTDASKMLLTEQVYKISDMSDRMGYRIIGDSNLEHLESADIISEPIAPGSVQIPSNGQPIILLNDRQTIGGYTKIATVSFVGRERLSQLKANDEITFKWISVEEASESYKEYSSKVNQDIELIKIKKFKSLDFIRPKSKRLGQLIKGIEK